MPSSFLCGTRQVLLIGSMGQFRMICKASCAQFQTGSRSCLADSTLHYTLVCKCMLAPETTSLGRRTRKLAHVHLSTKTRLLGPICLSNNTICTLCMICAPTIPSIVLSQHTQPSFLPFSSKRMKWCFVVYTHSHRVPIKSSRHVNPTISLCCRLCAHCWASVVSAMQHL